MRNPQFYVSGMSPMITATCRQFLNEISPGSIYVQYWYNCLPRNIHTCKKHNSNAIFQTPLQAIKCAMADLRLILITRIIVKPNMHG